MLFLGAIWLVRWTIWLVIGLVIVQAILIRIAQRSALVLGETVFAQLRETFIETVTALPLSTVERAGTGAGCTADIATGAGGGT